MPALASTNFTIRCMMCLHYFSFSVMADKGFFVVWGIVEFKTFHVSFCLMPPTIIEFANAVAFLCIYLT